MTAMIFSRIKIAKLLIEKGADLNIACKKEGYTALMTRTRWSHRNC